MHYTVFVKFNPRGKIEVNNNEIIICLRSKPDTGKAKKELVKRLASYFEVSRSNSSDLTGIESSRGFKMTT